MHRRKFIQQSLYGASGLLGAPALLASVGNNPKIPYGFSSGDVTAQRGVIWSRSDRPAQLIVELSTRPDFKSSQIIKGTLATPLSDWNAHAYLKQLIPDTAYYYQVSFQSIRDTSAQSKPLRGRFQTAPNIASNIRFCWSGDTAGQGFGIDPAHDGMLTYESIRQRKPDFLVHCGDLIYADNPMQSEIKLDDGSIWRNQLTEAKTRVAESIDDFRQNFYYNLGDHHLQALLAEVPIIQQWDDHEVVNNWYPGEILDDDRYTIKDVSTLAHNAKTAYFNCNPVRPHPTDPSRIYRKISRGPLLDLFVIDLRSYRGPNTRNDQTEPGPDTTFLGEDQLTWLKQSLKASTATWKIICSDMPIGLVVPEWGKQIYEASANADDGPPLGRELELAELFHFIAKEDLSNIHFITADVHYCASHYYDPAQASFKNFKPFWEFVSGPIHAGNFGPNPLDATFGPEVKFIGIPDGMKPFRPPSEDLQFFGEMEIDAATQALTVRHFNRRGVELWKHTLEPEEVALNPKLAE